MGCKEKEKVLLKKHLPSGTHAPSASAWLGSSCVNREPRGIQGSSKIKD